ncbi:hypothetical protein F53441_11999 [Fusarium austroafricanum]|uniref:Protein kinase domain-containing protein n=1 Tax=Fusarium austroafricanum TaxID=2364996 RepID=A0A8H4JZ08_9HYPO|nr:hypothetical protein F53441_11999 [Fusarium austroafricanum]
MNKHQPFSTDMALRVPEQADNSESGYEDAEPAAQSLADIIYGILEDSIYPGRPKAEYLPEGDIDELITEDLVREQLRICVGKQPDASLVKFIVTDANKIFALTCSVLEGEKIYKAMQAFKAHGFNNKCLPVELGTKKPRYINVRSHPGAFKDKSIWNASRSSEFFDKQWRFLSPVFDDTRFIRDLDQRLILPMTQVNDQIKEGTFGDIYQVKINRKHLDESLLKRNDGKTTIAVKEIRINQLSQQDASKAFKIESEALSKCRHVIHPNMLPCLAAFKMGPTYYFLFPWADGGSLRDFWKNNPKPNLSPAFIVEILKELHGLAGALEMLHNYAGKRDSFPQDASDETIYNGSGGIRHGDLKPENILMFMQSGQKTIGTLKIADMGLAKHHEVNTRLRENVTSTKYGTRRYEPPETSAPKLTSPATSRLYDTWSMGCIILEFVMWLLYGQKGLDTFNESIREDIDHDSEPPYYIVTAISGPEREAVVHPRVVQCLKDLSQEVETHARQSAVGDLVSVVRDKLLIVNLPSGEEVVEDKSEPNKGPMIVTHSSLGKQSAGLPRRVTARVLRESLGDILDKAERNAGYLFTGNISRSLKSTIAPPRVEGPALHPDRALNIPNRSKPMDVNRLTQMRGNNWQTNRSLVYLVCKLDIKVWDFTVDNHFAARFFAALASKQISQTPPVTQECGLLCQRCESMEFWAPQLSFSDSIAELNTKRQHCRWCEMRWEACKYLEKTVERVRFNRFGSVIKLNENDPPVFSIFKSEDFAAPTPIQIGRPSLPQCPKDAGHFQLLKQWLENCDDYHPACRREIMPQEPLSVESLGDMEIKLSHGLHTRKLAQLPTRLVDVGTLLESKIHLYETQIQDKPEDFKYLALSHPWGEATASNPHFCTTISNLAHHLTEMKFDQLPNTFKDAVTTTRALGIRYLWIDSLCIIQGPGGDFNTESGKMEQVFSCAYCVIAASRALGQCDGFLMDRVKSSKNEHVTIKKGNNPPFFISRFLDDFNNDVLEGSLNQRGWVLQERALARRTIYFTEKQTYWECGDGVRCETLTKMNNQLAAFLGDPNFPKVAIHSSVSQQETSRGQRILYYQDLYKTYSRLSFTHWEDRAVAMNGLEQRLASGFKCRGKLGILDEYLQAEHRSLLHRSLLWIRAVNRDSLQKITFPSHRQKVPTWSWMAFRGEIDYLKVPFNGVEWDSELRAPWQATETRSTGRSQTLEMRATAYQLSLDKTTQDDAELIFNSRGQSQPSISHALCVIVGRAKGFVTSESRPHYVLLVRPTGSTGLKRIEACERVGAGSIPGRFIDFEKPSFDVVIV